MLTRIRDESHTTFVIGLTEVEAWELLHALETCDERTNASDGIMVKLREWLGAEPDDDEENEHP